MNTDYIYIIIYIYIRFDSVSVYPHVDPKKEKDLPGSDPRICTSTRWFDHGVMGRSDAAMPELYYIYIYIYTYIYVYLYTYIVSGRSESAVDLGFIRSQPVIFVHTTVPEHLHHLKLSHMNK